MTDADNMVADSPEIQTSHRHPTGGTSFKMNENSSGVTLKRASRGDNEISKAFYMSSLLNENIAALLSAILYGTCSVSIAVVNKTLLTSYEFNFPVVIMTTQMLFTIVLLEILSYIGVIKMPKYTYERFRMFVFPALFYGINSILALSALSHMNIALYGVLKRCCPMVTMLLSYLILKKDPPTKFTGLSITLLTLGCIVAGFGDLKFNLFGYMSGAFSNITQAIYLILVQKATSGKLSTVESLQLNSITTLPLLAVFAVLNGEFTNVQAYSKYNEVAFVVVFFLAVSLGCLLNYSLFLCTKLTSALTTSVVGGLKALAQTMIGLFTFGGVSHNVPTYFGISMSLIGGISYIVAKYYENRGKNTIVDLRKVMSFSTAEDLKEMKSAPSMSNLLPVKNAFSQQVHVHLHGR